MSINYQISLDEFVDDLFGDDEAKYRYNMHIRRWISQFACLNELTSVENIYNEAQIIIKHKYLFYARLYKLIEQKEIKTKFLD